MSDTGMQGDLASYFMSLSSDGRYVAYESNSTNLVVGDNNARQDVFVHDRNNGTVERVSIRDDAAEANGNSNSPSISADGRYVAFDSYASNLVAGDANGVNDVFVYDRQTDNVYRVSVKASGAEANSDSLGE